MKCLIIGASSGIGKALALEFSSRGWKVILTARRTELLEEIRDSRPALTRIHFMDVRDRTRSLVTFSKIFEEEKSIDVVIVNAGINTYLPEKPLETEADIVDTNVCGFMMLARTAFLHFLKQGHGHLAAVSSVAGLRGSPRIPAYSASKAFVSNYMQGLRGEIPASMRGIFLTDILPGFVDTPMISRRSDGIWVSTPEKAARQIAGAILKRKKRVYVTKRWALISLLYRLIPDSLFTAVCRREGSRPAAVK